MIPLITAAISGVTNILSKREGRKTAKIAVEGKIAEAKQRGDTEVTLKDAEWENLNVSAQDKTWKDEYITLIMTWPIVGIMLGSLWMGFTGDERLLQATTDGLKAINEVGIDMGFIMEAVVLAAIGLKIWRA